MDIDNLDDLNVELPSEYDGLPVFVVGGAVRDTIRGVNIKDIDLMVAETDEFEMKDRGFREIDSSNNETFGVFQDSVGREVAIARQESHKEIPEDSNPHTAFEIEPVPSDVPASEAVELDSSRRDFTINSLMLDVRHNVLHDPHNGVSDLEDGVLRAVDYNAFVQDPLRVLRGARFAARLEFDIEDDTKGAMWEAAEHLPSLPQERVRRELEKVLVEADEPRRFFDVLREVAALGYVLPELHELTGVPAGPEQYHQEGDALEHSLLVLQEMKKIRPDDELALLMALFHDIGKGVTDNDDLPNHPHHARDGAEIAQSIGERLGMSNEQTNAIREASKYHMMLNGVDKMRVSTVIEKYQNIDNLDRMIDLVKADARGRRPRGEVDTNEIVDRFVLAEQACEHWTGQRLIEQGYDPEEMGGKEFGDLLRQRRTEYMRDQENDAN